MFGFVGHMVFVSSATIIMKTAIENKCKQTYVNKHGCVPIKLYLWTLKLEFHISCIYHKNVILLIIRQPLKKKAIHHLPSVQKQAVGWIWPPPHRLPTSDIEGKNNLTKYSMNGSAHDLKSYTFCGKDLEEILNVSEHK